MKKSLAIILASLVVTTILVLVGCGSGSSNDYNSFEGDGFSVEFPKAFEEQQGSYPDGESAYSTDKFYTATIDDKAAQFSIMALPKDMLFGADTDSMAMMKSYYTEMSGASLGDFVEGSVDGQPSISANTVTDMGTQTQVGSLVGVELKNGQLLFVSVNQQGTEFTSGLADYAQHLADHIEAK